MSCSHILYGETLSEYVHTEAQVLCLFFYLCQGIITLTLTAAPFQAGFDTKQFLSKKVRGEIKNLTLSFKLYCQLNCFKH